MSNPNRHIAKFTISEDKPIPIHSLPKRYGCGQLTYSIKVDTDGVSRSMLGLTGVCTEVAEAFNVFQETVLKANIEIRNAK